MSLTWDPSEDYEVFDGLETVTITHKGVRTISVGGVATYSEVTESISALKRLVGNRHLLASPGELRTGDAIWEIPHMSTLTPIVGDMITQADGTVWRIVKVDDKPVLSMWRAFGRV